MTEKANSLGFHEVARRVADDWNKTAKALNTNEDYYGFYNKEIDKIVTLKIEDMLTEVEPNPCIIEETKCDDWNPETDPLISLLNNAWEVYLKDPATYYDWENGKIAQLLQK